MQRLSLAVVQVPAASPCGECTACCTVLAMVEYGKPYYESCEHVCDKGCGIYKDRPESCRGYECLWLSVKSRGLDLLPDDLRPDKCGLLLHIDMDNHGLWAEVYEVQHEAWLAVTDEVRHRVSQFIEGVARRGSMRGVRFYKHNAVVAQLFPVGDKYRDRGQYGMNRNFATVDGWFHMYEGLVEKKGD